MANLLKTERSLVMEAPSPYGMRSTASQGGGGYLKLKAPLPNPLLQGEGIFIEYQSTVDSQRLLPLPMGEGWGEGTRKKSLSLSG